MATLKWFEGGDWANGYSAARYKRDYLNGLLECEFFRDCIYKSQCFGMRNRGMV